MNNDFLDSAVSEKFESYPLPVREKLTQLRTFIFDVACELDIQHELTETLKWGQPAYSCKTGSTIRIDSIAASANQYAIYFHCQSKLVDTFKQLYDDSFVFQGNRAIIFTLNTDIPVAELKHCISLAFRYHQLKGLPMLGC